MLKRVVLITGASRGIGREVYRSLSSNAALACYKVVRDTTNEGNNCFKCDLDDRESIRQMAAEVSRTLGSVDIIVHCAGVYCSHPKSKASWKTAARQDLKTNFFGTVHFFEAMQPLLLKSSEPRVVVICSMAGNPMCLYPHNRRTLSLLRLCVKDLEEIATNYLTLTDLIAKVENLPGSASLYLNALRAFQRISGNPFDINVVLSHFHWKLYSIQYGTLFCCIVWTVNAVRYLDYRSKGTPLFFFRIFFISIKYLLALFATLYLFVTNILCILFYREFLKRIIASYQVSKVLQLAYTRVLAQSLKCHHKRSLVLACCPGYVATDMNFGDGDLTPAQGAETPTWLALTPAASLIGMECQGFYQKKTTHWFGAHAIKQWPNLK